MLPTAVIHMHRSADNVVLILQAFTAEQESPLLLQHEFRLVQTAPAAPDMHNFSLKANSITREVVAVMEIEDGAVLEMVIKLPSSSPLRRAEVACRRRVNNFIWLAESILGRHHQEHVLMSSTCINLMGSR